LLHATETGDGQSLMGPWLVLRLIITYLYHEPRVGGERVQTQNGVTTVRVFSGTTYYMQSL